MRVLDVMVLYKRKKTTKWLTRLENCIYEKKMVLFTKQNPCESSECNGLVY